MYVFLTFGDMISKRNFQGFVWRTHSPRHTSPPRFQDCGKTVITAGFSDSFPLKGSHPVLHLCRSQVRRVLAFQKPINSVPPAPLPDTYYTLILSEYVAKVNSHFAVLIHSFICPRDASKKTQPSETSCAPPRWRPEEDLYQGGHPCPLPRRGFRIAKYSNGRHHQHRLSHRTAAIRKPITHL